MKKIALSGKHGKGKYALVDDEDYEILNNYKWFCTSDGYVRRTTTFKKQLGETKRKSVTIYMSRFIMNTPDEMEADHRDGNTLNNQKYNLRNCTRAENEHNKNVNINNKSGYKGVSYDKIRNRWIACIMINGKNVFLGRHETAINAARAYNEGAIKYHGEFANLNVIDENAGRKG